MDALESALERPGAFPAGLFWLHRGEEAPYARVSRLLTRARHAGVEAALVRVQNFDEAVRDILRLITGLDAKVLDEFGKHRVRWTAAPPIVGNAGWPVVRLNALRVAQAPTVCRRIVCDVGGFSEVRQAVKDANVDLLTARTKSGVLAFGSDTAARAAFHPFNVKDFDLATIEVRRLRYDSAERGLLRDAVARAIGRHRCMSRIRKRSLDLLYPDNINNAEFASLKGLVGHIEGKVEGFPELVWREGLGIRLEWAADSLWVIIEPGPVFVNVTPENKAAASAFGREHTFNRYNQKLDGLIDFWSKYLLGDGGELRAMGVSDGVDAVFSFSQRTAFSRRASV